MADKLVGKITHYYDKIGVAVVNVLAKIKVGDTIRIKAPEGSPRETDFTQAVSSMQIEHKDVEEAKKGESIGLKVKEHAREHDKVFVVEE